MINIFTYVLFLNYLCAKFISEKIWVESKTNIFEHNDCNLKVTNTYTIVLVIDVLIGIVNNN